MNLIQTTKEQLGNELLKNFVSLACIEKSLEYGAKYEDPQMIAMAMYNRKIAAFVLEKIPASAEKARICEEIIGVVVSRPGEQRYEHIIGVVEMIAPHFNTGLMVGLILKLDRIEYLVALLRGNRDLGNEMRVEGSLFFAIAEDVSVASLEFLLQVGATPQVASLRGEEEALVLKGPKEKQKAIFGLLARAGYNFTDKRNAPPQAERGEPRPFTHCAWCLKHDPDHLCGCSRCALVAYCDQTCQAAHYKLHKRICRQAGKAREES